MFPTGNVAVNLMTATTKDTIPTTHKGKISFVFDFNKGDFEVEDGRVKECSGTQALEIWILKALHTQKNRYKVYEDTEYGALIEDLTVGTRYTIDFIESELRREIEDILFQNEQITGVSTFSCEYSGGDNLLVKFKVITVADGVLDEEVVYSG